MKKWKILQKKLIKNLKIFDLFQYTAKSPYKLSGKYTYNFYVINSVDWVNILPITSDNEVVFVEQYRPGTNSITLELPGGMIDKGETPLKSAKRELEEETGYITSKWKKLGSVHPNPAILNNNCYTFLASGVQRISDPMNGGSEYTKVKLVPLNKVEQYIINKKITHSLVINAFYLYRIKQR